MKLVEFLNENLDTKRIGYKSSRPNYKINDSNPYILILDKNYPPRKKDGVLAFNLHYLKFKSIKDRNKFIKKINKFDNTIINPTKKNLIFKTKQVINKLLGKDNNYPTNKNLKIKRYKEIIQMFPELKNTIRHYKKKNIKY